MKIYFEDLSSMILMRYLGIDYGLERIGLALSDPGGEIALPYKTVTRFRDVVAVIKKERVGGIVVGMPILRIRPKPNEDIKRFCVKLSKTVKLPIEFENEAFTTKIAEQHTSKDKADASAAALILQSYLDRQRSE